MQKQGARALARELCERVSARAKAGFAMIRTHLIKLGARIHETAARIKIACAAARPQAMLLRQLANAPVPAAP